MKNFLTKGDLDLVKGGYLVNKSTETPVYNAEFVRLQERAEYLVTFAQVAKGKNFNAVKVDNIEDVKNEVSKLLEQKNVTYVSKPETVEMPMTSKLKEEAMSFINFKSEGSNVDKVNNFLQEFNTLKEFEEFGLFFREGVVKLNKIYTLEEVVEAVKSTIDLVK